ncbi:hypothetical protein [Streptomyces sp. SS162]|uniref:hypothetical protein n=1 Tax=Streptomyces sp. SS162 TaxID=3108484 RepID=UPI002F4220F7
MFSTVCAVWRAVAALSVVLVIASCAVLEPYASSPPGERREPVHVAKADVVGVWRDSYGGELRLGADGDFSVKRLRLVEDREEVEGAPEWPGSGGSWVFFDDLESSGVLLLLDAENTATFETVSKDGHVLLSTWADEGKYYDFTRVRSEVKRSKQPSTQP